MSQETEVVAINKSWMNISSSKKLYIELMETWVDFFLFFSPAALIIEIFNKNRMYLGFFIIIPFFIETLLKRYTKNLIVYILANAMVILLALTIYPNINEKVIYGIVLLGRFIMCIKQRYEEAPVFRNFTYVIFNIFEFVFIMLAAMTLRTTFMSTYTTLAALNNTIFLLIYLNITRTDNFMQWEGVHLGKFKHKINMSKLLTTVIILTIMLGSNIFFWKSGLYSIMDFIQHKIAGFFDPSNLKHYDIKDPPTNSLDNLLGPGKLSGTTWKGAFILEIILKVLGAVICTIIFLIMVYFILILFLKLISLYKSFGAKNNPVYEKKESLLATDDIKQAITRNLFKLRRNVKDNFDNTNNKQVRKLYYKLIKKKMITGFQVSNNDTPFEIKERIEHKTGKDYKDITEIYEKARYSNMQCKDSDVQTMKKLSK